MSVPPVSGSLPVEVTSPLGARILAAPHQARLLKPFMRSPKTLGQAAAELGVPLKDLHYRVRQLCAAGLLQVVGEQPRRGRPCKLYQATGTSFRVACALIPDALLSELESGASWERELDAALERFGARRYEEALTVRLQEDGTLLWRGEKRDPEQGRGEPEPLRLSTAGLYLSAEEARQLRQDLQELFRRYHRRGGPKRYGLSLTFAPLDRPVD